MEQQQYNNYSDAFKEMQRLTSLNKPFKLVFKKLNGNTKIVPHALLRKQTHSSNDTMSAYKFNYVDMDKDDYKSAYIPLLLSVNDIKVVL